MMLSVIFAARWRGSPPKEEAGIGRGSSGG